MPRDLVLSRIGARRVCVDCGTNYVATGGDRSPWICDNCGGDVMQRDDDTPEAVTRRLDLYEEQTAPLIEYYQSTGRLVVVDGRRIARAGLRPPRAGRRRRTEPIVSRRPERHRPATTRRAAAGRMALAATCVLAMAACAPDGGSGSAEEGPVIDRANVATSVDGPGAPATPTSAPQNDACHTVHVGHDVMHWTAVAADEMLAAGCAWPYAGFAADDGRRCE